MNIDGYSNKLIELESRYKQLQSSHPVLLEWQFALDNAKRRAGACFPHKRRITLSEHHIGLNSLAVCLDTLVHEVAHALAWAYHKHRGHGKYWQHWVTKLGGTPKATGRFNTPEAKWVLVRLNPETQELEKVARRHRRNAKIAQFMLRGKPETKGCLYYVSQEDYQKWLTTRSLAGISLIQ